MPAAGELKAHGFECIRVQCIWYRDKGQGSGFRFRVYGIELRVQGIESRVYGIVLRVQGIGFRV